MQSWLLSIFLHINFVDCFVHFFPYFNSSAVRWMVAVCCMYTISIDTVHPKTVEGQIQFITRAHSTQHTEHSTVNIRSDRLLDYSFMHCLRDYVVHVQIIRCIVVLWQHTSDITQIHHDVCSTNFIHQSSNGYPLALSIKNKQICRIIPIASKAIEIVGHTHTKK